MKIVWTKEVIFVKYQLIKNLRILKIELYNIFYDYPSTILIEADAPTLFAPAFTIANAVA